MKSLKRLSKFKPDSKPKPKVSKQKRVRRHPRIRHNSYRGMTLEIYLKLILSWIIAIGAIASLCRLIPYHFSQQAKLDELKIQVQETDARVTKLREQLNHNFDPQQTQNLMEQYSSLTSPNQRRIYWLKEDKNTPGNPQTNLKNNIQDQENIDSLHDTQQ